MPKRAVDHIVDSLETLAWQSYILAGGANVQHRLAHAHGTNAVLSAMRELLAQPSGVAWHKCKRWILQGLDAGALCC